MIASYSMVVLPFLNAVLLLIITESLSNNNSKLAMSSKSDILDH
jgi:hypothetical protein